MEINEEILRGWKDRLNKIYNELLYRGIIDDKRGFAKLLKKNYSNIVQALKGSKDYLTENFVREICSLSDGFFIDFNWFVYGEGDVMATIMNENGEFESLKINSDSNDDHELINLYRENSHLYKENKALKDNIINLQKDKEILLKENGNLKARIEQLKANSRKQSGGSAIEKIAGAG